MCLTLNPIVHQSFVLCVPKLILSSLVIFTKERNTILPQPQQQHKTTQPKHSSWVGHKNDCANPTPPYNPIRETQWKPSEASDKHLLTTTKWIMNKQDHNNNINNSNNNNINNNRNQFNTKTKQTQNNLVVTSS